MIDLDPRHERIAVPLAAALGEVSDVFERQLASE